MKLTLYIQEGLVYKELNLNECVSHFYYGYNGELSDYCFNVGNPNEQRLRKIINYEHIFQSNRR